MNCRVRRIRHVLAKRLEVELQFTNLSFTGNYSDLRAMTTFQGVCAAVLDGSMKKKILIFTNLGAKRL